MEAASYIQPRLEWNAHDLLASNVPDEILWAIFGGGMPQGELVKAVF